MREQIELDGVWRFQPDPCDEGEKVGWFHADFDRRMWREVTAPASFNQCGPGMDSYEGIGWYVRHVTVPANWQGRRVILRFEGANHLSRVWVNGQPAGENPDGFLRFELHAGDLVRFGQENVIAVRVDSTRRKGEVPGLQRGWRPFGGLLREVCLTASDPLWVEDVRIDAALATGGGRLTLTARIVNDRPDPATASVSVTIVDADGKECARIASDPVEVPAGARVDVKLDGDVAGAAPWSPDDPRLYTAEVELADETGPADARAVRFGFRRIEARDGKLLLNGEPIFLVGFNRHEDSPDTDQCTDLATARRDLLDMKAMGANFVRLCHYPHHPGELDLCDELGLLAMGEIPLYWWDGLDEGDQNCRRKLAAALRQMEKMVRRDWNHPSVIFWSASNETLEDKPEVVAGNAELVELARKLDPTRLAVHVSDPRHWPDHPHFESDDVICVNAYPAISGRFADPQYDMARSAQWWRDELDRLHELHPDKPILITEFGYPCLEGVFGCGLGEDVQARAIEAQMAGMDAPYVCGATIWCYADHAWPAGSFLSRVAISPFGVVSWRRRRLAAWETVAGLFHAKRGLARPAGDRPVSTSAGVQVNMIRADLDNIADASFPKGFGIRTMRPDEGAVWVDIHRDAEEFLTIGDDLFQREFGYDPQAVARRCFLIVNDRGSAVGTISAWYDRDCRGLDHGRVHWVATRPAYQRRGLARAGLSHTLKQLAQWHQRAYLTTQTGRLGAIRLYLDFGFVPDLDLPGAAEAWRDVAGELDHPALESLR
ncbi:MAG: GNAT family N-acetyltransferase [Planctomycetota bacterium]|jgi:beta-glucuronidase